MAKLSPAKRKLARIKRGATLDRQVQKGVLAQTENYVKELHGQHQKTLLVLFAILAQHGDLIVTQGTFDQVVERRNALSWTAVDGGERGETEIRLMDRTIATEVNDALNTASL